MSRKLLQFQSLLSQHALRGVQKPRPQFQPHHHRLFHSHSAPSPAPPSPSAYLLWNRLSGGTASSLLPRSAAAVVAYARTAASRWLAAARGAGSLDLFSLQRRWKAQGSWTFLQGAAWASWMQSPDGVVLTLVGVNVTVFMLWCVADPGFMRRHFMISLDNFKRGRLHTLLTSAFSHAESHHLISNMIGLYFFGTSIARTFGPAFVLKLYVAGALTGSAFFLLEKAFLVPREQVYVGWDTSRASALGASAAVNATILLQIFLNPKGLVYLYFVIPIPAAFVGAALIAADLYRAKGQGHASGSAPLGGVLVAALVWARIRKGWRI
ncbi:RHOMBOID-like protein 12, mitochondrial [Panicum miliaceum]|uniref:RHOMBOID-like protein 12, mitochondrial n=1 Tax=Panicum miliaceum TaxID=4540 RepID=A0A3L6SMI9_PANMI|nr:RHOMBOID-like protein 12, mitochondrial [Panicum miliaceum]